MILPAQSTSIFIAFGVLDKPGMSMTSPVSGIKNPAPAETLIPRMVILKFFGRPKSFGLSESDRLVFAMQIGNFSKPSFLIRFISFSAFVV